MMKLNLISQKLKKDIKLRHIYEILFRVYVFFGFTILTLSVIVYVADKILQSENEKTSSRIGFDNQDVFSYEEEIKAVNDHLEKISNIQSGYIAWTEILKELANISNDGLSFSSIIMNKEKREAVLRGRASNGVSLLDFKRKLDKSLILRSDNFPIENIAVGEDIDFTVILNF